MSNSFETWAEIFGEVIGRSFVLGIREGLAASGLLERLVQARRQEAARALEEARLLARREAEEAARARAAFSASSGASVPGKRGPRLDGAARLNAGGITGVVPPRRRGRRRKVDIDAPPPEPPKPVQARPPLIRRRGVLVTGASAEPTSLDAAAPSTAESAESSQNLSPEPHAERSTEQIFQALVQAANTTPPNGTPPKSGAAVQ
jgi:hypothetical protein